MGGVRGTDCSHWLYLGSVLRCPLRKLQIDLVPNSHHSGLNTLTARRTTYNIPTCMTQLFFFHITRTYILTFLRQFAKGNLHPVGASGPDPPLRANQNRLKYWATNQRREHLGKSAKSCLRRGKRTTRATAACRCTSCCTYMVFFCAPLHSEGQFKGCDV